MINNFNDLNLTRLIILQRIRMYNTFEQLSIAIIMYYVLYIYNLDVYTSVVYSNNVYLPRISCTYGQRHFVIEHSPITESIYYYPSMLAHEIYAFFTVSFNNL